MSQPAQMNEPVNSRLAPKLLDEAANQRFREKIIGLLNGNPDSVWNGGYVDHVWEKCRQPFIHYLKRSRSQNVLEFGCNIGATSVVLAHLGAKVQALDIDPRFIEIARDYPASKRTEIA